MLKEYNEILEIIKETIMEKDFDKSIDNDIIYTKEFIKSLICSNDKINGIITKLREKKMNFLIENKNVFYILKNWEKKIFKHKIVILNSLNNFGILYDQPSYIQTLNNNLYNRIVEGLSQCSKFIRTVSIMNGYAFLILAIMKKLTSRIHLK
jgi:hypothetical protein